MSFKSSRCSDIHSNFSRMPEFAVPKQVDQIFSSFTTKGTRVDLFYTYLEKKVVCRNSSMEKRKLEYSKKRCP